MPVAGSNVTHDEAKLLQRSFHRAAATAEICSSQGQGSWRSESMRDSRDGLRVVLATVEQQSVLSCGPEPVKAEKLLTPESIVLLNGS